MDKCGGCCDHYLLHQILYKLTKMEEHEMATQADLDAVLTQVVTIVQSIKAAVVAEDSDVAAVKTAVDALLAKTSGSVDLATETQALQSALSDLTTSSAEIVKQHTDLQATVTKANA